MRLLPIALIAAFLAQAAHGQDPAELAYGPRTDWSKSEGQTNISMFLFTDVNANGSYDLGDRAMAGIVVGLAREGQGLIAATSNANGFANFKTSVAKEDAVIDSAGTYLFQAVPPPGWTVTTGNEAQTLEFFDLPGSITGLGIDRMMSPVGLTPERRVTGRHPGGAGEMIRVHQDGYVPREIESGEGGLFSFVGEPGAVYTLIAGDLAQRVEVGEAPINIGTLRPQVIGGEPLVVHFDDGTRSGVTKVPNGYEGLSWFNLNFVRRDFEAGGQGYQNGTTSQPYSIYTSSGIAGEIGRDTPFVFDSMKLTLAWKQAEGDEVRIEAWRGEDKVNEDRFRLSTLGPTEYQPRIGPVTRIRISTAHQWQVVIDDVVISELQN